MTNEKEPHSGFAMSGNELQQKIDEVDERYYQYLLVVCNDHKSRPENMPYLRRMIAFLTAVEYLEYIERLSETTNQPVQILDTMTLDHALTDGSKDKLFERLVQWNGFSTEYVDLHDDETAAEAARIARFIGSEIGLLPDGQLIEPETHKYKQVLRINTDLL